MLALQGHRLISISFPAASSIIKLTLDFSRVSWNQIRDGCIWRGGLKADKISSDSSPTQILPKSRGVRAAALFPVCSAVMKNCCERGCFKINRRAERKRALCLLFTISPLSCCFPERSARCLLLWSIARENSFHGQLVLSFYGPCPPLMHLLCPLYMLTQNICTRHRGHFCCGQREREVFYNYKNSVKPGISDICTQVVAFAGLWFYYFKMCVLSSGKRRCRPVISGLWYKK